jgi:hypothetical protein
MMMMMASGAGRGTMGVDGMETQAQAQATTLTHASRERMAGLTRALASWRPGANAMEKESAQTQQGQLRLGNNR